MEEIFEFLNAITLHNDREWFHAHKDLYSRAERQLHFMAEQMICGISKFDSDIVGLKVSDCTYRIYRDTRFSSDKTPYKRHMGIYVCPRGKKSNLAGYYLHFEAADAEFLGRNLLCSGMHSPDAIMLKRLRDEVLFNGRAFEEALLEARNFELDLSNSLSRPPKGFPKGHPYDVLLRLRQWDLFQDVSDERLADAHFMEWVLEEFRSTLKINQLLNRAVLLDV